METKFNRVRGTRDILPPESELYRFIEKTAFEVFEKYQFREIRLPTFENTGLFIRSTGETTDIVEKEMYVFTDKKGRNLALRPEGTPGIVRAYLENNLQEKFPINKFCYCGQMFRYERPQEGRYREFYQIGCEYFDNSHPAADTEIILIVKEIYSSLGINGLSFELNSIGCLNCRDKYRAELLKFLHDKKETICEDCRRRVEKNPLRALDCKIDREKFINSNIPTVNNFLCADCLKHFEAVRAYLTDLNIDFKVNPCLVRGLDYYTRTVFEAKTPSSDIVVAGGRYNNLIKQLGGKDTPAVGFALGVERTAELMKLQTWSGIPPVRHTVWRTACRIDKNIIDKPGQILGKLFLVVEPKDNVIRRGISIFNSLHKEKISIAGPYPDKSLKSQMRMADSAGFKYILILGEQEITNNAITLRNMADNTQELISQKDLISTARNIVLK